MENNNLIQAISSGSVGEMEEQIKTANKKRFVISSFSDHSFAETSGLIDDPEVEVVFADTEYTRFISNLAENSF